MSHDGKAARAAAMGEPGWFVVCICGRIGQWFSDPARAEEDQREHIEERDRRDALRDGMKGTAA